jgi:hypothetical protein
MFSSTTPSASAVAALQNNFRLSDSSIGVLDWGFASPRHGLPPSTAFIKPSIRHPVVLPPSQDLTRVDRVLANWGLVHHRPGAPDSPRAALAAPLVGQASSPRRFDPSAVRRILHEPSDARPGTRARPGDRGERAAGGQRHDAAAWHASRGAQFRVSAPANDARDAAATARSGLSCVAAV